MKRRVVLPREAVEARPSDCGTRDPDGRAPGALYGIVAASGAQAEYDMFCPNGQMPPPFCSLLLSSIATYHTITFAMAVVLIVGLAVTSAALAMKGPLFSTVPAFVPRYPPPLPPTGAS